MIASTLNRTLGKEPITW